MKTAENIGKRQRVLLQINSSGENRKAGFSLNNKKEILECINMPGIKVEGLMTMGPNTKDVDIIAKSFQKTKKLFDRLARSCSMSASSVDVVDGHRSDGHLLARHKLGSDSVWNPTLCC